MLNCEEAFYGGAAGGGKSESLLMAALQYVDCPGYAAIIFRKSYAELILPGALMDRAREWLTGTDAEWKESEKTWHFPSGATITFGYLDNESDIFRYQSAEFQFAGFDELTEFSERQYRFLFSRLRRPDNSNIPLRIRSASNPGGAGHDWVKQRFVTEGLSHGRIFIPAKLDDNPSLDREAYIKSLNNLDPVTRQQLLNGDWSARTTGSMFKREWFKIVDSAPANCSYVRRWDLAATEAGKGKDPDWTAGCLLGISNGNYYVKDMKRMRGSPQSVEALIKQTAQIDGVATRVFIEQEPGAGGKSLIDYYTRQLAGFTLRPDRPTADKTTRASPVSSQAEAGNIYLVNGLWINDFLDEIEAFPSGAHDDQVDALSGAFVQLSVPDNSFDAWNKTLLKQAQLGDKNVSLD
ncbi:phage terminase large subunit [Dehalococcoides mccartyi]|uniref:phage terminase large subunit n=1 Tax=Dehalococcoides mccartyi TaxID=61435 RepID=UPI003398EBC0